MRISDWSSDVCSSDLLIGLAGVDSRAITRRVRDLGAPHGTITHFPDGTPEGSADIEACRALAADWPGLEGMDLAAEASCRQTYHWAQTRWEAGQGYGTQTAPRHKGVAVDYGAKRNIHRCPACPGRDGQGVPAAPTPRD